MQANPPQLHSNLLYIQRFRRQSRLVGESAYFFTNILSAESFISNIDAKALSMDETEFERNMESARALLSGLSTDSSDKPGLSYQTSGQIFGVEKNQVKNLPTPPKPSEDKLGIRKVADADQIPVVKVVSQTDLENRGATMLLKEDQWKQVFQDFPYLFANVEDLTISDVESLLNNYKQLVLKYVCLSKDLGVGNKSLHPSNSQFQDENARDSEPSRSTEPDETGDESKESIVIKDDNARDSEDSGSLEPDNKTTESTGNKDDGNSRIQSENARDPETRVSPEPDEKLIECSGSKDGSSHGPQTVQERQENAEFNVPSEQGNGDISH